MYLPYLRGKQYELIALREISDIMAKNRDKISPIIEPVKNSSTLQMTLKELRDKNINFNIIVNPSVGELKNQSEFLIDNIKTTLSGYDNFQLAIIVDNDTNISDIITKIKKINIPFAGITFIHEIIKSVPELTACVEDFRIINNVIYFQKTSRRYHREFEKNTCVELEDFFNSQSKNSNYLEVEDSFFTEEHLFFSEESFKGFSDFLTIGDNYSESGFLPYAVAIHLSYEDEKKRIRVRHFVSDSNDDTSDIGGKFIEALDKLVAWCEKMNIHETYAISQFKELHKTGHFPGLGSLKKLSIMNHIELVLNLI